MSDLKRKPAVHGGSIKIKRTEIDCCYYVEGTFTPGKDWSCYSKSFLLLAEGLAMLRECRRSPDTRVAIKFRLVETVRNRIVG